MTAAGRVVCFGEVLLRLGAPGPQLLQQASQLEVWVGGAEANVAIALASLGHRAAMVTVLPDNALGLKALGELRRHGVDTRAVGQAAGRMGLYFLDRGAGLRAGEVLYDRSGSAFINAGGGAHDWSALLAGADWLHVSGVTPALGAGLADAALAAVRAARRAGVRVSFDANFRSRLWQAWAGDAPAILGALMAEADLLFANERDMQVVLGRAFEEGDAAQRFQAAARAAFARFANLECMAATVREQRSVEHHVLRALCVLRDGSLHETGRREVWSIVERTGAGDAFAAGVLHGLLARLDAKAGLEFALAAACLKHSVPGDASPLSAADIAALVAGEGYGVRR
jgi:2-dehydro-3-deoxygluconokinase